MSQFHARAAKAHPDTPPIEELGPGRSKTRDRVLAPIFKDLKLMVS